MFLLINLNLLVKYKNNNFNLISFIENKPNGEFSLFDNISYRNALESFSGKEIANILSFVNDVIYNGYTQNDIDVILMSNKVDHDFKRVLFYNLYIEYSITLQNEYLKCKRIIKNLLK